jgi:glycosyltransferase involved in cell wall biosynthesis
MNPSSIEFASCTIIAKNYISMARVLAESWHRFHPGAPFFVLLLDSPAGYFSPENEDFTTLLISELGIPNLDGFLFKYSILEASTAVKPYLLRHLFRAYGIHKLLYLDPDILLLGSLDSLSSCLSDCSILLTPHLTTPLPNDGRSPTDHSILQAGIYNLGFLGLRDSKPSRNLLDWWCEKLYHECIVSFERNLFVDQRWMDLVPGLFDGVRICRDPGYNIAYWNLHERRVTSKNGKFIVNGNAAYFFHFSGFNPDEPQNVSKYQGRFPNVADLGETGRLYARYRQLLIRKAWHETKHWKYDHNFFDNGVPIPGEARKYYWGLGPDVESLGNPFAWLEEAPKISASPNKLLPESLELPIGINVMGYLNSETGTGEGGRSNLRIVEATNLPYVANVVVANEAANVEQLPQSISEHNPYAVNLITVNADQFTIFAKNHGSYLAGHYNIGYWAWEMPEFPPEWATSFAHVDEIWTPSQFTRDAVASASPVPVRVVPHSIDPQMRLEPTVERTRFGIPADAFVFLFFFDFHSFVERKNPLGLIAAYKKAFGSRTDIQLLIKSSHGSQASGELRTIQEASTGANVRILDCVLSRDEKNELMMAADCYVSLHRSEGFGLTMAEAMLCGKPTVATDYSGNCDFMSTETGFPVPYKLVDIERDHGPYQAGQQWAQPDLDYAADVMRYIEANREAAVDVGKRAKAHISSLLDPITISKDVRRRLQELGYCEGADGVPDSRNGEARHFTKTPGS